MQDKTGLKLNDSCEETGNHFYSWAQAENGQQIWKCTQCGKEEIEYEDSQP